MHEEQWDTMNTTNKLGSRSLYARAIAHVYQALYAAYPVKLNTAFDKLSLDLGMAHPLSTVPQAIEAAVEFLLDEGLARSWSDSLGKSGCTYHGLILTTTGYVFFSELEAGQLAPKFIATATNPDSPDERVLKAFNSFVGLLSNKDDVNVWRRHQGLIRG